MKPDNKSQAEQDPAKKIPQPPPSQQINETGGPKGPEPTRYGDWERNGRCIDF
ncbi:MAG: DUF1674 domain-containing protein [Gammaproteobacteria bacterium]